MRKFPQFTSVLSLKVRTPLWAIQFSNDGRYILTTDDDISRQVDITTGKQVLTLDHSHLRSFCLTTAVRSVCFSPDGQLIATGTDTGYVSVRDTRMRSCHTLLRAHEDAIESVAFVNYGQNLMSGDVAGVIKVWEPRTYELGKKYFTSCGISSFSVSQMDGLVAVGAMDDSISVKCVRTDTLSRLTYPGLSTTSSCSVAFSANSEALVGAFDKTVVLWKRPKGHLRFSRDLYKPFFPGINKGFIYCATISPQGNWIMTGSVHGELSCWNTRAGGTPWEYPWHDNSIQAIAHSPTDNIFATASADGTASVFSYK